MRDTPEDVSVWAVKIALADMPETFHTTNLSNHPEMLRVHAKWAAEPETRYHQMVGMYLSRYRSDLNIEKLSSTSDAQWRKRAPRPAQSR